MFNTLYSFFALIIWKDTTFMITHTDFSDYILDRSWENQQISQSIQNQHMVVINEMKNSIFLRFIRA